MYYYKFYIFFLGVIYILYLLFFSSHNYNSLQQNKKEKFINQIIEQHAYFLNESQKKKNYC